MVSAPIFTRNLEAPSEGLDNSRAGKGLVLAHDSNYSNRWLHHRRSRSIRYSPSLPASTRPRSDSHNSRPREAQRKLLDASRRTRNCMVVISGLCHRPLIQCNQTCRRNAAKSYRYGTPCNSWWQPTLLVHHSSGLIMAVLMTHLYIFMKNRIGACYVGARGLAGISRPSLCRPHTTQQHKYDWPKKLFSNVIAFARAIKNDQS